MADEHIRAPARRKSPADIRSGKPSDAATAPAVMDKEKKSAEHKDTLREIIDTVVIVIVLVLLLKTFVAEAFVIPTGSMAPTLLGYHHNITCPQCGQFFRVNASTETPEPGEQPDRVLEAVCPNCRYRIVGKEYLDLAGSGP